MKIFKIITLAVLATVVFSCSKDSDNPVNQESKLDEVTVQTIINTSDLTAVADDIISDIFNNGQSGKAAKNTDCYTTETVDEITTITFSNCIVDGNEAVNGSITAEWVIDGNDIGIRITYIDLSIGEIEISGVREMNFGVTNQMGHNSIVIDTDVKVVMEDGTNVLEKGSKTLWFYTDESDDLRYALDGEWTVSTNGKTFNVVIEENLETIVPCAYFGSGLMTITEGQLSAALDFGDGTCDNKATFTYPDGSTEEITLKD